MPDFEFTFQVTMSSTCQIYMSDIDAVSFYLKNNGIRGIINHTNIYVDRLMI